MVYVKKLYIYAFTRLLYFSAYYVNYEPLWVYNDWLMDWLINNTLINIIWILYKDIDRIFKSISQYIVRSKVRSEIKNIVHVYKSYSTCYLIFQAHKYQSI